MVMAAYKNNVFLFCLPPKTTHQLQPLDVLIFGQVQEGWAKLCEDMAANGDPVNKSSVMSHYITVRKATLTSKLILDAWRHSGHYPVNPKVFTEEDFAPSQITSCVSHLPADYPPEVPSSPQSAQFVDGESGEETDSTYASEEVSEVESEVDSMAREGINPHW